MICWNWSVGIWKDAYMANIITGCRILCSIFLLFVPVLSPIFYFLYLVAGFTDMIDGTIAILAALQEGYLIRRENHKLKSWFFSDFLRTLIRRLFLWAVMQFLSMETDDFLSAHSVFWRAVYWDYIPYTAEESPVLLWFFREAEIFGIHNHFLGLRMLLPPG